MGDSYINIKSFKEGDASLPKVIHTHQERSWVTISAMQPIDTTYKTLQQLGKDASIQVDNMESNEVIDVPEECEVVEPTPITRIEYKETIQQYPEYREYVTYEESANQEKVIRYISKGEPLPDKWKQNDDIYFPGDELKKERNLANNDRIEHVYRPTITNIKEEVHNQDVDINVQIPYIVPKPNVIPIEVPVLKFDDEYIPVPIRRRIIPKVVWTDEIYEVECIREVPTLMVEEIIKPVATDADIIIEQYTDKAAPINPSEMSQADIHAMWMRVNADLLEEMEKNLDTKLSDINDKCASDLNSSSKQHEDENKKIKNNLDDKLIPNITKLQKEWMGTSTLQTHQLYNSDWFQKHQQALYDIQTNRAIQSTDIKLGNEEPQ